MSETRIKKALFEAKSWWAEARGNSLFHMGVAGAVIIAMADRASKFWIVEIIELQKHFQPCIRNPSELCAQIAVSPIFDLTFVRNTGASFGLFAGGMASRIFLSLLVSSVVIGLLIWLGRLRRSVAAAGVAFVIGGALGNLYDRIAYGYVVDFLDFSAVPFLNFNRIAEFPYIEIFIGGFIWVFNVADVSVNVGVALLLLDAWNTRERKPPA